MFKNEKNINNIIMIYIIGMLSGFVNGFFTCGAGQIIIFYLVFLKKYDTFKSRGTSIAVLSCASLISIISYFISGVTVEISKCIIVFLTSLAFGFVGSKIMKKFSANSLNLTSGALMVALSLISILRN